MSDETDAVKILTAFPLEKTTRTPTTWMKTIQQDLKSNNLSLNEAVNVAQNRPLWKLTAMFALCVSSGACHKRRRCV